jgi:hypothetical protein
MEEIRILRWVDKKMERSVDGTKDGGESSAGFEGEQMKRCPMMS